MSDPALASAARTLVVLHAAAAIVLIGATTHHALIAYGHVRGRWKLRLARIYGATSGVAYLVTFALGLLAYPTFRYQVRALYLDRYEPWASNLFDTKENFAALALPLFAISFLLSRLIKPDDDRALVWTYAACTWLAAAIIWFDVFSGLVITMTRGV